jgi:hypothetical protein
MHLRTKRNLLEPLILIMLSIWWVGNLLSCKKNKLYYLFGTVGHPKTIFY